MKPDIVSKKIDDNETWNECFHCHKFWKNKAAIPGTLLKINICEDCNSIIEEIRRKEYASAS